MNKIPLSLAQPLPNITLKETNTSLKKKNETSAKDLKTLSLTPERVMQGYFQVY